MKNAQSAEIPMNKQEALSILKSKNPITRSIEEEIKEKGIAHGSHVIGGANEWSDIDYLMSPKYKQFAQDLYRDEYAVEDRSYDVEDGNFCIYLIDKKDRIWNLIFMNDIQEYKRWVRATEAAQRLCEIDPFIKRALVSSKDNRVKMIQMLRSLEVKPTKPEGPDKTMFSPYNYDIPF